MIEHNTSREITLEMMSKANREKMDLLFAEKRINGGKKQNEQTNIKTHIQNLPTI